jgi:hypothetical protein
VFIYNIQSISKDYITRTQTIQDKNSTTLKKLIFRLREEERKTYHLTHNALSAADSASI